MNFFNKIQEKTSTKIIELNTNRTNNLSELTNYLKTDIYKEYNTSLNIDLLIEEINLIKTLDTNNINIILEKYLLEHSNLTKNFDLSFYPNNLDNNLIEEIESILLIRSQAIFNLTNNLYSSINYNLLSEYKEKIISLNDFYDLEIKNTANLLIDELRYIYSTKCKNYQTLNEFYSNFEGTNNVDELINADDFYTKELDHEIILDKLQINIQKK